jgi:hypothetical protein
MIYKSHKKIRKPITVYAVRVKIDDKFCKSPIIEMVWQLGVERIEEDDAEYLRHHIHAVIFYRKLKVDYKRLKRGYTIAGIIDNPIVKSVLRKQRFKIKELRDIVNLYYFMHTKILREKK